MFKSVQEIRDLLNVGEEIFKAKPEISQMSASGALDYLDNGTQEMIHNRWGAAARMFVAGLRDYSFESILEKLDDEEIPEYLSELIMFLLQDEYGVEIIPFMIFAQKKGRLHMVSSYCSQNIAYGKRLNTPDLVRFIDLIEFIPQANLTIALSNIAKLIISTSNDKVAFEYAIEKHTESSMLFLTALIEELFYHDHVMAEKYLVFLLELPTISEFIMPIVLGLKHSLRKSVAIFEKYYPVFSPLEIEGGMKAQLIPCYIEYIDSAKKNDIWRKVFDSLHSIENASSFEKSVFFNATNYRKDLTDELAVIKEAILKHSFGKDIQMLNSLSAFFYRKMKGSPVEEILEQLYQIFVVNGYNLSDYRVFFDAFDNIWSDVAVHVDAVWNYFLKMIFGNREISFAFALGLYEDVIDINRIEKDILFNRLTVVEACILLKLLTAYVVHPQRLCRFAFQITNLIEDRTDQSSYSETYMCHVYRSYPRTSNEISEEYLDSKNDLQHALADAIKSQFEADQKLQQKWIELPDLWPSDEHRRIFNLVWYEQNHNLTREAMNGSFFASMFPSAKLKYGKKVAFVQKYNRGKHRYMVQDLATFESSVEIPKLYKEAPLTWLKRRAEALEERSAYVETYSERLSITDERKG